MLENLGLIIYQGFQAITPAGTSPEFFWPTFLLVFAVVYTLLEKTRIFGETGEKKGTYLVIGLIISYFTASSAFATMIISKMTPQLGMILTAVLFFLLIFAFLMGGNHPFGDASLRYVMYFFMIVGAAWLFFGTFLSLPAGAGVSLPALTTFDVGLIIIGVFILILFAILFR